MIEKFNFYDIYGYFLPGLALLGVLWLPFGVSGYVAHGSGWSSAIVVGAAAYILGHLLQSVATSDLSSKVKDQRGRLRFPSDILLDEKSELLPELVEMIAAIAKEQFGLELLPNKSPEPPDTETDRRRNAFFFLARQVLIDRKEINYAEQFQGMYAVTRGLCVVFAVACSYWFGWAASSHRHFLLVGYGSGVFTLALLVLINVPLLIGFIRREPGLEEPKWRGWVILKDGCKWLYLVEFFTVGYIAGVLKPMNFSHAGLTLSLLAGVAFLASVRTYDAYKYFAGRFAITVWRDFLAYQTRPADSSAAPREIAR